MPKEKVSLNHLKNYIPEGSFDGVMEYLTRHKVQLTVTRQRQTILGDYRHAHAGEQHRISVNGNLNKYAFLITLLHELAHLFTYERYGHRVQAHGAEWKNSFANVLSQFLQHNVFPEDIAAALGKSLNNPAASSCADEQLLRILKKYDPIKEGFFLLEQLPPKAVFAIKGGRVFEKGERVRKRYKCREIETGKLYLFSPVYEVKLVNG